MELVQLGGHRVPVVPQRHARLRHHLTGQDFSALVSGNYGAESYKLLAVLVPALAEAMPLWEWDGYESEQAMTDGRYDEGLDRSPTTEEIAVAFETVLKVNGAGRLGKVMDLAKLAAKQIEVQTQTPPSLVSPGVNGG